MNFGNRENKEPTRTRKLLLHKKEILKINSKIKEKKLTLVPILIYKIKLEIGLAKGKKLYDKREDMVKKDVKRKIERYMKYE